jgi:ribonuclease D
LAKLQPETVNDLNKIRSMNERIVRRYGKVICRLITEAKQRTPTPDDNKKSAKKRPKQEAVLDVLTAVVRMRADENSLNPVILASRKDLEKLLLDEQESSLLLGWRYSMVGKELQGLLKGQYTLTLNTEDVFLTKKD